MLIDNHQHTYNSMKFITRYYDILRITYYGYNKYSYKVNAELSKRMKNQENGSVSSKNVIGVVT